MYHLPLPQPNRCPSKVLIKDSLPILPLILLWHRLLPSSCFVAPWAEASAAKSASGVTPWRRGVRDMSRGIARWRKMKMIPYCKHVFHPLLLPKPNCMRQGTVFSETVYRIGRRRYWWLWFRFRFWLTWLPLWLGKPDLLSNIGLLGIRCFCLLILSVLCYYFPYCLIYKVWVGGSKINCVVWTVNLFWLGSCVKRCGWRWGVCQRQRWRWRSGEAERVTVVECLTEKKRDNMGTINNNGLL